MQSDSALPAIWPAHSNPPTRASHRLTGRAEKISVREDLLTEPMGPGPEERTAGLANPQAARAMASIPELGAAAQKSCGAKAGTNRSQRHRHRIGSVSSSRAR